MLRAFLRPVLHLRTVYRPEIEAMLNAELRRHKDAMSQLLKYAAEQEELKGNREGR